MLCSQRWILAYIGFVGFCVAFSLRDNVNVAIVCMVRTNVTSLANETRGITKSDCIPNGVAYSSFNDVSDLKPCHM